MCERNNREAPHVAFRFEKQALTRGSISDPAGIKSQCGKYKQEGYVLRTY